MGFFDQLPEPATPPPQPARPAWARPETSLPGIVPDNFMLARTGELAIAVGDLLAYPNGFEFAVTVFLREPLRGRHAFGPDGFLGRFGGGPVPDDFLRLGLRFADGTVVTNLDAGPPESGERGPRLVPEGGSGGMRRHEQRFWVWPLPPPGSIDVVCQWPARGVPETSLTLDAGPVLDAARRAVTVFP